MKITDTAVLTIPKEDEQEHWSMRAEPSIRTPVDGYRYLAVSLIEDARQALLDFAQRSWENNRRNTDHRGAIRRTGAAAVRAWLWLHADPNAATTSRRISFMEVCDMCGLEHEAIMEGIFNGMDKRERSRIFSLMTAFEASIVRRRKEAEEAERKRELEDFQLMLRRRERTEARAKDGR